MSHDTATTAGTRAEDPAPESPARSAAGVLCLLLFAGAFALFAVSPETGPAAPWLFTAGIVAFGLAFAIPTTILPAIEDRERP